ncbi:TPA: molybdopterin-guanine dinucleotide biosynthesis protein B [Clostridium perfringens]|uniref:molybdopterin-guanine dinucleotide biosynthesis protein B n=1 Tax=Clostridium perfringens TaxID=1502 RepID=UPI0018996F94|nr:molybdopterin-guanine dinucleotide biosynthesis protein B [Clostridium perfringens]EGT3602140.1 molybdopterin-guanine dinucleotide biosynthesis protein B [Clostridium perfringens]EJT6473663.1 molybdopterin-guanine dinucleotide biosynthesis protein B [Clostridium perfringens]EJT6479211.1 molybdopterin-guanine dinucleotide biosynthesis protein B [Clostridium perfringens]EJT6530660.1 molybdopterin-guanine dinucleotide biosynthesis protein B [Clostridium perfringens]MDM0910131.1 molybdopterin-g
MAKIVNVVASCSNTGKTVLIEGLIKELKNRGYTVATIKHDVHGFDIDKEGKDTWRHRKAGAEAVIISSKERMALIREVQEEVPLEELIKQVEDFDFIIIEGYKKSKYRKLEVYRQGISNKIITPKEKLIGVASDVSLSLEGIRVVDLNNYEEIANLVIEN